MGIGETEDWNREEEMERQIEAIQGYLRETWPTAADWNVLDEATDERYAEVLDKDDKVLGYLSERQLTAYWNRAEGILIVKVQP